MPLIKCPECGKEISDASISCIHCGYPLKKEQAIKVSPITEEKQRKTNLLKKIPVLYIAGAIALILAILLVKGFFPHTVIYKEFMQIISTTDSAQLKYILGDDYTHTYFDPLDSTADIYYDMMLDSHLYDYIVIGYDDVGRFKNLYIQSDMDTAQYVDVLKKDMIATFGKSTPDKNEAKETYSWICNDGHVIVLTIEKNKLSQYDVSMIISYK